MSDYIAKIVIMGMTGVGKTSLADRLRQGEFSPSPAMHGLTIGSVDLDTNHTCYLWDTPPFWGHAELNRLMTADASLGLYVVDSASSAIGDHLELITLGYLRDGKSSFPIILVRSRVDRYGPPKDLNPHPRVYGFHFEGRNLRNNRRGYTGSQRESHEPDQVGTSPEARATIQGGPG